MERLLRAKAFLNTRKPGTVFLLVLVALSLANAAAEVVGKVVATKNEALTSDFLGQDFQPDGDLSKPVWAGAERVRFDADAFQSQRSYPELETWVASRWSGRYLYLAFWCRYVQLHTYHGEDPAIERWNLWERDVVEAFLSPQPEISGHYYEFEVAPNNQWIDLAVHLDAKPKPLHDMHWNSGFDHAVRIDAERHEWTVEMRIPIAALKASAPAPGMEWRVNFYRADGKDGDVGAGQRLLSWRPMPVNNGSFHQPASFGVLRFIRTGKGDVRDAQ
jgi:hypothetical protein